VTPPAHRILIVDDDPAICQAYKEILTSEGYDVLTASGRADALQALERVNGAVDLFVVDFGLRDADGPDFARDAVAKYGRRPTLYVSGWTDEFWDMSNAPGPWAVLRKPVPVPDLLEAIRSMITGGPKSG
jgi:two-component system cell cycle sensor histidine kinase/response regulator CckA